MARVLFVVPPTGFRDEELFDTRRELEAAGHRSVIASVDRGLCLGMLGGSVVATETLTSVHPSRFDAVVFVGGAGARLLFDAPAALELARAFHEAHKPTAAICMAPVILGNAGVLEGREATVAAAEQALIEAMGAHYQHAGVVTDGDVVTASGPREAAAFGRQLVQMLAFAKAHFGLRSVRRWRPVVK